MARNKIKISLLSFVLLAFIYLPIIVLAIEGSTAVFPNPIEAGDIKSLLTKILDLVVQIGVVVVTGGIIYSGFLYATARGNTAQITKAHNAFKYTLIGATIVLGAYAIAKVVGDTACSIVGGC